MEIEEVLVAKIVSGGQCGSRARKTSALTSNFSVTASMMMSAAARSGLPSTRNPSGRTEFAGLVVGMMAVFIRVTACSRCFRSHPFLFHVARQPLDDPLGARLHKLLRNIEQHHAMPRAKHDMGNSMPHLACAHYSNNFGFHVNTIPVFPCPGRQSSIQSRSSQSRRVGVLHAELDGGSYRQRRG